MPTEVGGDFVVSNNPLESLVGGPMKVGGNYVAATCHLECMNIQDTEIGGNFTVINNKLKTLIDGPWKVGGSYLCDNNKLQTLIGLPDEIESIWASKNNLINLDGCPTEIKGHLEVSDNKLISLKGAPNKVSGRINVIKNPLSATWKDSLPEQHGEVIYDGLIEAKIKVKEKVMPAIPDVLLSSWNKLSSVRKNEILSSAIKYSLDTDMDILKWWLTRGIIIETPVEILTSNSPAFIKIPSNITQ
jgi:hypothetical protein